MLDRTDYGETVYDSQGDRVPSADGSVEKTNNGPPGVIDSAQEAFVELSAFLKEHPVVQSHDEAKQLGAYKERTKIALDDARAERDSKTKPLNERLKVIRTFYDIVREKTDKNKGGILEAAYNEARRRLTDYATAVEAARLAIAEKARAEAEEAERVARAAEEAEREAIASADVGELTDVGGAIAEADGAFKDFQKAGRAAAIAERAVPVRIGSIMGGRSLAMRSQPDKLSIATVEDACSALRAMGLNPEIEQAICAAARKFEKTFEEYPAGITVTKVRSM